MSYLLALERTQASRAGGTWVSLVPMEDLQSPLDATGLSQQAPLELWLMAPGAGDGPGKNLIVHSARAEKSSDARRCTMIASGRIALAYRHCRCPPLEDKTERP